ncbi:hypothetical protein [Mycobacterium sp. Z3061]|uniref:hypothetical protein n=1 Tax=Mycobacterium sp. Z3061 TaxID=3073562 RepID=UPI0028737470|nr:hypothetical protein [Mycobacterium sp. Z3061]
MTEPDSEDTKQISVAELLARNGTIGAPAVTRRRRRRRGDDSVTVAELTGEIPVIRDDRPAPAPVAPPPVNREVQVAEAVAPPEPVVEQVPEPAPQTTPEPAPVTAAEPESKTPYWAEPEPRWPKSEPITTRRTGPERSEYPRPVRHLDEVSDSGEPQSGADSMSPDPVGHYTDASVDVLDSEISEAEEPVEDSAYVRSYLQESGSGTEHTLFGGQSIADEVARRRSERPSVDEGDLDSDAQAPQRRSGNTMATLGRAALTVLQSILAVAFGAGLFIAFDQLWRWNSIVALVLSVLVILGLVVGVRVVRKTEDIASTLIAVAVGALITLGPMALLQTG